VFISADGVGMACCSRRLNGFIFGLMLLSSMSAARENAEPTKATTITVAGSRIDVLFEPEKIGGSRENLIQWVRAAAEWVSAYYGRFPVPHVCVRVMTIEGSGVHNGRTWGKPVPHIVISVGRMTNLEDLRRDWTMTHEMVHLAFPSVPENHHWIEEGTATYVEPIARVQAGYLAPSRMWSDLVRDLPQGLPGSGDEGLDVTHTWGRTYWGGALFCFLADLEIHQQTHNQKGLQDALRGILAAGGNIIEDWPLERALEAGDRATSTHVLENLYAEMKTEPSTVSLAQLWSELGIKRISSGEVSFADDAPLASARKSITAARTRSHEFPNSGITP
jgi:hypothetical protein